MATTFATATGADAVITIPADTDPVKRIVVGTIVASYSGSVTTGRLRVMSGATLVVDVDVGQEATGRVPAGLAGEPGQPVEIRLFSGGGAVVGKLNVLRWWKE